MLCSLEALLALNFGFIKKNMNTKLKYKIEVSDSASMTNEYLAEQTNFQSDIGSNGTIGITST